METDRGNDGGGIQMKGGRCVVCFHIVRAETDQTFSPKTCRKSSLINGFSMNLNIVASVALTVPSDSRFPWRQVRPLASNEDMKRWTAALCSLHLRTRTMTSPAMTAQTAVTASTHLPAPRSLVSNSRADVEKRKRNTNTPGAQQRYSKGNYYAKCTFCTTFCFPLQGPRVIIVFFIFLF